MHSRQIYEPGGMERLCLRRSRNSKLAAQKTVPRGNGIEGNLRRRVSSFGDAMNFPDADFLILPSTKVGALLERYPELEDVLIGLAPPFRKLKNPLLRRGVAKVASLQHAAVVGGIPVVELVNKLRAAVGQSTIAPEDLPGEVSYFSDQPGWFDTAKIVTSIDERAAGPDKMPIAGVLQAAVHLHSTEILQLITTFVPAPGIDILKRKGFLVWSVRGDGEFVRTYVARAGSPSEKR
jgi:hypothetical protein